jgi:hypothetical protein
MNTTEEMTPEDPCYWTQGPYEIIKHFRGNYQVLNKNGRDMIGHYVSLWDARQTALEHKLQDKAMVNPRILQHAEALTTYKGESLNNWLYQILIRFDKFDLRLLLNKPNKLKELSDVHIERAKKRLNS